MGLAMSTTEALNTQAVSDASHRIREWWLLDGALEKVKVIWTRMSGHNDYEDNGSGRGPAHYAVSQDEVRRLLRGLGHLLSRPPSQNSYKPGGDEKPLLKWILGVLSSLLVIATVGVVTMYGKMSAIEAFLHGHEQRLQGLERINESRYRGPSGKF